MANLVPRSYFDFSPFRMPSIFDDMDDLVPEIASANNFSISEDNKHIHVDAAMPGIKPDDIEVTFDKGVLWVRGQAREEDEDKDRKYYRKAQQTFSYRIAVPGDIDFNVEPQASYENGMIRVTLAKSPKSQPKKLTIKLNDKGGKEAKSK